MESRPARNPAPVNANEQIARAKAPPRPRDAARLVKGSPSRGLRFWHTSATLVPITCANGRCRNDPVRVLVSFGADRRGGRTTHNLRACRNDERRSRGCTLLPILTVLGFYVFFD